MEVQVLSSAPRSVVRACARAPAVAFVVAAVVASCSRDQEVAVTGSLTSDPPLLLAPPSDRANGVVHGRLLLRLDGELPAGTAVRILQGYDENGGFWSGPELRYALAPLAAAGGRALGVGARVADRRTHEVLGNLAVTPLAPELGWLEVKLKSPFAPTAELQIQLGDPERPDVGPATNSLPIEVELAAKIVRDDEPPAAPPNATSPTLLAGRVPVRIVDATTHWLRVLAPAQARPDEAVRLTVLFMNGWSGPLQSSIDSLLPAGTLHLDGPFGAIDQPVRADDAPAFPHGIEIALPQLPAGRHRIAARFQPAATTASDPPRELRGLSNPIDVRATSAGANLYFGSLHNHTLMGGHATSTPSRALRYARDVTRLDFCAMSEHREAPTFDGAWLQKLAERESVADRFVVFTAWEWTDAASGHRHVVARAPSLPPPAPRDLASFAESVGHDADELVIAHHPLWNGGRAQKDFDWGAPDLAPRQLLAEAYSWHGCSLDHESAFPLHGNHDQEFGPERHTSIVDALARGHRLFLVADSDNHLGKPGALVGISWPKGERYAYQGVTVIRAAKLERDTLFRALESGQVYGTTGARIRVEAERTPATRVHVSIAATAPLALVSLRSPTASIAARTFERVAHDAGTDDAPLFVDAKRGTWDVELDLDAAQANGAEPWIVEVAQQDFHHAWLLLPPPSWVAR